MPMQSLSLLNSEFTVNRAKQLAARLKEQCGDDARARIELAFRLTAGRPCSDNQCVDAIDFIRSQEAESGRKGLDRLVPDVAG